LAARLRLAALAVAAAVTFPAAAQSANFVVTTNADSGPGSLANAIDQANASSDPSSSITFAASLAGKTIVLGSELPAVEQTLTITGPNNSSSGITNRW
jgi:fibronectin-binding autotransporter adhesin